ncbi:MAG TPA: peptide chain release factor 1 [Planctomycetota bacterium]|nr:peptide chain release factor 1 [Planctomycetota bacterium]HRR79830.1 peptide chain release factor 1 [Planctomycetota bacterium]HRT92906.1 peptide chain release factor 1 [Planctomycetota bacterium]
MLTDALLKKLDHMSTRYAELEGLLASADVASSPGRARALSKELGSLTKFVRQYRVLRELEARNADTRALLDGDGNDPEFRQMAQDEIQGLEREIARAEEQLKELFATDDSDTARDVIVEIRAGTGGEEAALFVADLFRMYQKYAERKGWKTELLHSHATDLGGLKEVFFSVEGQDVYKHLRHESGVHRVQRVPATEASGRRHTSTVTVAVLPAAEEEELEIRPEDLEWDTFRSSGPGGQNVNKVSSAVRLTHVPTGTVVSMQDDRSQHKNRSKALRVLRSILYERKRDEEAKARGDLRRSQVGTGDRSERIRTYNFPENRLSDHRIGLTLYKLDAIMLGDLDDVVNALVEHAKQQRLGEL